MIPILYESNETQFTSNGIGPLSDALECTVTEERNGEYICELVYPVDGKRFDDIQEGRIIGVWHDDNHDIQPFDIYGRSAPIDGQVTFYASHISYRLRGITVTPFTADSCAATLASIPDYSVETNPFSFYTNKSVSAIYASTLPKSARSILGGEEGSVLDFYGTGEYVWDKWNVRLLTRRGSDTDVEIRYGKNLTDFEQELDYSESVTGIVPYWTGTKTIGDTEVPLYVTLPEKALYKSGVSPSGRASSIPYDFSDKFETEPTVAQLRATAQSFLDSSDIWLPSNSIKVDFVHLWETEEYKDVAPLQQVGLCDTVLVTFPKYNISRLRIKIIRTVYNALAERYDEMELGDAPSTFADTITAKVDEQVSELKEDVTGLKKSKVLRVTTEYARSSSASQFIATTTWSEALPPYVAGQYYWQRTATHFADGTVLYGDPIYSYVAQTSAEADVAADNAQAAADEAGRIAQSALDGVSEVEQHFWHDSTGAHIAENAGDLSTGASQTIASTGTVIMRNGKLVTSWTGSSSSDAALNFYDCSSASASAADLVASYARSGSTFYVQNARTMALTGSGMTLYDPTDQNDPMAVYSNGGIQLGKQGTANDGKYNIEIAPATGFHLKKYTSDLFYIDSDSVGYTQLVATSNLYLKGNGMAVLIGPTPESSQLNEMYVDGRIRAAYYDNSNTRLSGEVLNTKSLRSSMSAEATVPKGSHKDITVSYGITYKTTPNVVGCIYKTSNAEQTGLMSLVLRSVGKSSATFRVFNRDTTTDRPVKVSWFSVLSET